MKSKILGLLFLSVFALAGCDKQNNTEDEIKNIIALDENQLLQTVYADELIGKSALNFKTTDTWTASITSDVGSGWISITSYDGNAGEHNINIALEANYTGVRRTATITITCKNDVIKANLRQEATTQTGQTLKAVTGVTLNKTTLNLVKGNSETLTATVEPSDATLKTIAWSSSNTSVATVDASTGKIIAVAKGTTTITAISVINETIKASCKVTVTNPIQGRMTVNGTSYEFESLAVSCGRPPLGAGYTVSYIATTDVPTGGVAQFAVHIFFDTKKITPEAGTFTVKFMEMKNNMIFSSGMLAPGVSSSGLKDGTVISVEPGADMLTISYDGFSKNGDIVKFIYAGTYELNIEPGL